MSCVIIISLLGQNVSYQNIIFLIHIFSWRLALFLLFVLKDGNHIVRAGPPAWLLVREFCKFTRFPVNTPTAWPLVKNPVSLHDSLLIPHQHNL